MSNFAKIKTGKNENPTSSLHLPSPTLPNWSVSIWGLGNFESLKQIEGLKQALCSQTYFSLRAFADVEVLVSLLLRLPPPSRFLLSVTGAAVATYFSLCAFAGSSFSVLLRTSLASSFSASRAPGQPPAHLCLFIGLSSWFPFLLWRFLDCKSLDIWAWNWRSRCNNYLILYIASFIQDLLFPLMYESQTKQEWNSRMVYSLSFSSSIVSECL